MSITVQTIKDKFPHFSGKDIAVLMGSDDFKDTDSVSLSRIAAYHGNYAKDLSIFAAKNEGKNFLNKVNNEQQRMQFASEAKIKNSDINGNKDSEESAKSYNSNMSVSIFDMAKRKYSVA